MSLRKRQQHRLRQQWWRTTRTQRSQLPSRECRTAELCACPLLFRANGCVDLHVVLAGRSSRNPKAHADHNLT